LGEHGPKPEESKDRLRFPAQEHPDVCAKRLGVYRYVTGTKVSDFSAAAAVGVEVMGVQYTDAHRKLLWHPVVQSRDVSVAYAAGQGRSRWLQAEDEVSLSWAQVRRTAEELLDTIACNREEHVCIVGLGTGAHVAFAMAEAMIKTKNMMAVRLFTICPPTVWPCEEAPALGALVTTPIRYLTCPESVAGPPWRLETSTFGAFSHSFIQDKAAMLKLVMEEVAHLSK